VSPEAEKTASRDETDNRKRASPNHFRFTTEEISHERIVVVKSGPCAEIPLTIDTFPVIFDPLGISVPSVNFHDLVILAEMTSPALAFLVFSLPSILATITSAEGSAAGAAGACPVAWLKKHRSAAITRIVVVLMRKTGMEPSFLDPRRFKPLRKRAISPIAILSRR